MHDPMVVAFEIRRPWPRRVNWGTRRWYWPAVVTVWHVEPGGRDSGTVCKHSTREQLPDGSWTATPRSAWKWHVHHWKIQVRPLQAFRRWLLTRCAWCGGPSRKGDVVNCSHSWDNDRARWWQGERGLYHGDCSTISSAWNTCTCRDPLFDHNGYGECQFCHRSRGWNNGVDERAIKVRELIPHGTRDRAAFAAIYRSSDSVGGTQ
jgi:hypothetical protein